MTPQDFKKLLEESLKPIITEQSNIRITLEESLKPIREEQQDLREIIEKRVLPSLVYVENTIKSYADQYVANKDHIKRLDKRLTTVEDNLGIQAPQELAIPNFEN